MYKYADDTPPYHSINSTDINDRNASYYIYTSDLDE